jgi:hypothetical protein
MRKGVVSDFLELRVSEPIQLFISEAVRENGTAHRAIRIPLTRLDCKQYEY